MLPEPRRLMPLMPSQCRMRGRAAVEGGPRVSLAEARGTIRGVPPGWGDKAWFQVKGLVSFTL